MSKWVEVKCGMCGEILGATCTTWGGHPLFEAHLTWAHLEKLTSDNL